MSTTARNLERLVEEVRQLPASAQLELIEVLVRNLKDASSTVSEPQLDIRDLAGLGKEHWEGIDPQAYIDEERASWE